MESTEIIRMTIAELNDTLGRCGYSVPPGERSGHDCAAYLWTQDYGWKLHDVELVHNTPAPLYMTIQLLLRFPPLGYPDPVLIGCPVEEILQRPSEEPLPSFFITARSRRLRRYLNRRISNTLAALAWFDQFATPESCLAFVRQLRQQRLTQYITYLEQLCQQH